MTRTILHRVITVAAFAAVVAVAGARAHAQAGDPDAEFDEADESADDADDAQDADAPDADAPSPDDATAPDGTGQLRIHVINTRSLYVALSYDVFSVSSRQVVGSGKGAIESRGEVPQTWDLPPGLYKIVKAGEPFDTPADYAVATVEADGVTEFVIVVDADTGAFRGSGPLTDDLPSGVKIAGVRIALNGGGTLMFNQKANAVGQTSGTTAQLGLFANFGLVFDRGDHFLDVSAELQLSLADQPTDRPYATSDSLEGSALYQYRINNPYLGPYVRAGFRTRVFPGRLYLSSDSDAITVNIHNLDGTTDTRTLGDGASPTDLRVKVAKPFAPLLLQEEVGANVKAVDLDLTLVQLVVATRLGYGLRQGITNGLLVVDPDGDVDGPVVDLYEVDDYSTHGPVVGASAKVTVARWLFGSARFGMMIPLGDSDRAGDSFGDRLLFDFAGTAGLKIPALTRLLYASFDYTFRLERDSFLTSDVQFDHTLMARANVTLF